MTLPSLKQIAVWSVSVVIAALGGLIATWIGTPLPWLLGGMVAAAVALMLGVTVAGEPISFPQGPRMAFITIIGVAIGGSATPGMWAEVGEWWISLAGVAVFVLAAHAMNYQLFLRVAGYDRPTAFYCATPGGLIESVQLGEEAGGNPALLTVQHFSRIAITVTLVPLIYWAMRGEAVGSAAGVGFDAAETEIGLVDLVLLAGCAVLGGWGGRKIGFPAAIITGPVILSTLVHAFGWTEAQPPDWLIAVAQLVIGLGLAMRFRGMTRGLLMQGIGLGLCTVTMMLALGAALAGAISLTEEHSFQILFMCYAPGGVVEMGLIALSLGVSPVLVTLHHIIRIGLTVVIIPLIGQRILTPPP
ncbi:MAG: AbrB family transcriptional regulator [Pseudomonadota bacterium]